MTFCRTSGAARVLALGLFLGSAGMIASAQNSTLSQLRFWGDAGFGGSSTFIMDPYVERDDAMRTKWIGGGIGLRSFTAGLRYTRFDFQQAYFYPTLNGGSEWAVLAGFLHTTGRTVFRLTIGTGVATWEEAMNQWDPASTTYVWITSRHRHQTVPIDLEVCFLPGLQGVGLGFGVNATYLNQQWRYGTAFFVRIGKIN